MNRAAEAQEPIEAVLRQYAQHVEKEVLAAKDERTRFIRLVILMATEVALAEQVVISGGSREVAN